MLRAIAVAAVFVLALPALAAAQGHEEDHRGGPPHPGPGGPPHPAGPPPGAMGHPGGPPPGAMGPHPGGPPPGAMGHEFHGPPPGGMGQHPGGPLPGAMEEHQHLGPPPGAMGGPHPGGQFSFHGHMYNGVHAHAFMYPPGWSYRRWGIGAVLPPIFLAPTYYYSDWATLGLDPPPPGTQWVRYGPDLLLVDLSSGNVIESVPDVFYE